MITLHHTEWDELKIMALNGTLKAEAERDGRIMDMVCQAAASVADYDDAIERANQAESEKFDAEEKASDLRLELRDSEAENFKLQARVKELEAMLRGEAGPEAEISAKCKGCEKPITWAVNMETGKRIPLDLRPPVYVNTGQTDSQGLPLVQRRKGAGVSHFATCANANEFSQSKKAEK